jgi:capsular exopolysaccharide synthesis family protein
MMFRPRRFLVDAGSRSAEPFRALRLAIAAVRREDGLQPRPLLVTSPAADDGKSTVAANYALVAASAGDRVLLLDGDLRRPSLHTFFDVARSPGLVETVEDRLDPAEAVRPLPEFGGLELLTAGYATTRPGEVVSSRRLASVLDWARDRRYDSVVIDSPPVLGAADASALAAVGTDVVLVVRRGARRRPATQALAELDLVGANVLGLVINRCGGPQEYATR